MAAVVAPFVEEGPILTEAYITDNGRVMTEADMWRESIFKTGAGEFNELVRKEVFQKSAQDNSEIGRGNFLDFGNVVEPPYNAEILAKFLEVDEAHFRCVKTKVVDSVGRKWSLHPTNKTSGEMFDASTVSEKDKEKCAEEALVVQRFIEDCNDALSFEGVLERVAMDHEAIGYGAIEVIRSRDMKVRRIAHVPASRIKVLKGWAGFVENVSQGGMVFYQPFGQKIVCGKRKPAVSTDLEYYNPRDDGNLDPAGDLRWNMIDKQTGEKTNSFAKSANEIIWIPKHHSNTIYYGLPDIIPALGDLLGNVYIRDYMLQFFQHNTIPQYAVIIEGAKVAEPVKQMIQQYFSQEVKGQAHKTLIIPVPATGSEVRVRFEKLAAGAQEGSFQDVRKNNQQGILTAHGVSPAIIGINDSASLGSGKGLSQAEIYKDRIVTPMQAKWERVLNKLFRLGLGVSTIEIRFNRLDIRDLELEMTVLNSYFEQGILTVNEVRKSAGLGNPYDGGDRSFLVAPKDDIVFLDDMESVVTNAENAVKNGAKEAPIKVSVKGSSRGSKK